MGLVETLTGSGFNDSIFSLETLGESFLGGTISSFLEALTFGSYFSKTFSFKAEPLVYLFSFYSTKTFLSYFSYLIVTTFSFLTLVFANFSGFFNFSLGISRI